MEFFALLCGIFATLLIVAGGIVMGILTTYGLYLFYIALFVPLFPLPVVPFFTFYFIAFVVGLTFSTARDVQLKTILASAITKCILVWVGYWIFLTWR